MKQSLKEYLLENGYDTSHVDEYVALKVKSKVRFNAWIMFISSVLISIFSAVSYIDQYKYVECQYKAESKAQLEYIRTYFANEDVKNNYKPIESGKDSQKKDQHGYRWHKQLGKNKTEPRKKRK